MLDVVSLRDTQALKKKIKTRIHVIIACFWCKGVGI